MNKITLTILLIGLLAITGCSDEPEQVDVTNITEGLNNLSNQISLIKFPACPSCNCPKYEEVICEEIPLNIDNRLALDKFQFRYQVIQDNYDLIKDKVEDDDDKIYCTEEIVDLRLDLDIALSYVQEFITKGNFEVENNNHYSYKIFEGGQNYFKEYLNDVELYCKGTETKITDDNYDLYVTHMNYYNNITINSDLKTIVVLRDIRE